MPLKGFMLLMACLVSSLANAQTPTNDSWLADYAADIRNQAIRHNLPGYVFVVVEKGRPPNIITFGETERNGEAIDENTVFRLASVSKTFTAMLMAKLVERKQLNWQTSLTQLAPEVGFSAAGLDKMTLTHLIGQSSGYIPNAYDNLIEANYPVKRVLNKLADLEPLCSPGRCYTYQNALFGVLEHYFSEQDSSFREQLDAEIFKPLNMPHASSGKAALQSADKWAKPHIAIARDKWRKGRVQNNYYRFSPAAGVNASIRDMVVWVRAMLGEYPKVVSQHTINTLTKPHIKTTRELNRRNWRQHLEAAHYGLGWRVYNFEGHKLNYHGGWVKGYRADVAFAPEFGVGYAMLMNAESNLINKFTADFWAQFFEATQQQQQTAKLSEQVGD